MESTMQEELAEALVTLEVIEGELPNREQLLQEARRRWADTESALRDHAGPLAWRISPYDIAFCALAAAAEAAGIWPNGSEEALFIVLVDLEQQAFDEGDELHAHS